MKENDEHGCMVSLYIYYFILSPKCTMHPSSNHIERIGKTLFFFNYYYSSGLEGKRNR